MGVSFGKQLSEYLVDHPKIHERLTIVGRNQECSVISDINGKILSPEDMLGYAAQHISSHLDLHEMGKTLRGYKLPVVSVGVSEKATKSVGHGLDASLYYDVTDAERVLRAVKPAHSTKPLSLSS